MVSGRGAVSTPLFSEHIYVTILEGISIANKTLKFQNPAKMFREGNIIIDSGTTLSYLPHDIYNQLGSTIKHEIKKKIVPDPEEIFDLCYSSMDDTNVPSVTRVQI